MVLRKLLLSVLLIGSGSSESLAQTRAVDFDWRKVNEAQPVCVNTLVSSRARVHQTKTTINLSKNQKFLGINQSSNARNILVRDGSRKLWISKRNLEVLKDVRECFQTAPSSTEANTGGAPSAWTFGVEVGYAGARSTKSYDNMITSVPDPSNVGPLQNPIIQSVDKGSGFQGRLFAERNVWNTIRGRGELGYRSITYQYAGKSNPTTDPNQLDSLPNFSANLTVNSVLFGAGAFYEIYEFPKGGVDVALRLEGEYFYEGQKSIPILVGTVFKRTDASIKTGPQGFTVNPVPRIEAHWHGATYSFEASLNAEFSFHLGYKF